MCFVMTSQGWRPPQTPGLGPTCKSPSPLLLESGQFCWKPGSFAGNRAGGAREQPGEHRDRLTGGDRRLPFGASVHGPPVSRPRTGPPVSGPGLSGPGLSGPGPQGLASLRAGVPARAGSTDQSVWSLVGSTEFGSLVTMRRLPGQTTLRGASNSDRPRAGDRTRPDQTTRGGMKLKGPTSARTSGDAHVAYQTATRERRGRLWIRER